MVSVVIPAGGKGRRMGAGINKVYLKLHNDEILLHTVRAFENNKDTDEIIVVTGKNDIEYCRELLKGCKKVRAVTEGGESRQQSVYNGVKKANGDIILVHDGARALISDDDITRVIKDCVEFDAAALGVKAKDTLKSVEGGFITGTVSRENTYMIQTPQAFRADIIFKALKNAVENACEYTDDCGAAEAMGIKIKITEGSYENIKITTPDDIITAERILTKRRNTNEDRTRL